MRVTKKERVFFKFALDMFYMHETHMVKLNQACVSRVKRESWKVYQHLEKFEKILSVNPQIRLYILILGQN